MAFEATSSIRSTELLIRGGDRNGANLFSMLRPTQDHEGGLGSGGIAQGGDGGDGKRLPASV